MGFKRCGNVENRACVSIYRFENLTATLTLLPARARAGGGRTEATASRDVGHGHHMPQKGLRSIYAIDHFNPPSTMKFKS